MGIRSRIKNLVFGSQEPARSPDTSTSTSTPTPPSTPTPTPTPAPKGKDDPEVRAKFEKIVAKAKLGVLAHVLKTNEDGRMSMADMHDHSERRYFIAHRSFSDLMETWTTEGLVAYDPDSGTVTVTEAGRLFVEKGGVSESGAQNRK